MHPFLLLLILSYVPHRALGIGIFILVLAMLLIFGCWFCKRRSGYKRLRVTDISLHVLCHFIASQSSFQSFTTIFLPQIPDAPPAYDKIAAEQSPPPYSP
uniref:Melan-A n=1 Tax=Pavo cristatus TaxID=9049 RepID=A0A8C9ELK8_PAVCR